MDSRRRVTLFVVAAIVGAGLTVGTLALFGVGDGGVLGGGRRSEKSDESGFRFVTDDSRTIGVEVPRSWDDVRGTPLRKGSRPYIQAAPDLRDYRKGFEAPGMEYILVTGVSAKRLSALLDVLADRTRALFECRPPVERRFSRRGFEGWLRRYRACRDVELWLLGATAPDGRIVVLGVQTREDDRRVVERALSTFRILRPAS